MMRKGKIALVALTSASASALATTLSLRYDQIETGDVLSLIGAMLGVILAVFGAIYVENHKAERERIAPLKRLATALERITYTRNTALSDAFTHPDPNHRLRLRSHAILSACNVLEYSLARIDIDQPDLIAPMDMILRTVVGMKLELEKYAHPLHHLEPAIAIQLQDVIKETFDKLQPSIDTVAARIQQEIESPGK